MAIIVNSKLQEINPGERLIDIINRSGNMIPQVCYHPQLGPIQTCDTCMVEMNGKLVRACGTEAVDGAQIETRSPQAQAAQREAFNHILGNHLLYCTVCDNNNDNCTVHNTTASPVEHQQTPLQVQTLRGRCEQSLLSLRSSAVHSLRALRGSLPGPASKRDPQYSLGRSSSARAVGWWWLHRPVELCFLWPLCHCLPVQCAHGEVDARSDRLLYRSA